METEDEILLKDWMENWTDIVDFEVFPVMHSEEAAKRMEKRTGQKNTE
jgi:NAD(P)H-flavin reductase